MELQQAQQVLNTNMEITNGVMKTLGEDTLVKFLESLTKIMDRLLPFINRPSAPIVTTGGSQSGNPLKPGRAEGGEIRSAMYNVIKTGEKGWEYIVGDQVIPHEQSVALEQSGVMPGSPTGNARASLENMRSRISEPTDFRSLTPEVFPARESSMKPSKPITVVVNVGNEELKRFVVNTVGDEF
jgi:hypothetical protein